MKGRCALALLALAPLASAVQFTANFDELTEGMFGPTMTSGGIDFYGIDNDLGGNDQFVIEEATTGALGPNFTPPNVLGFVGYVPGSGVSFGRLKGFEFRVGSAAYEMTRVTLDFWTFLLQAGGNTVTLEGWLGTTLVDSQTYMPGTFSIVHVQLSLQDELYDEFRIVCNGPVDNGVLFANVDNVVIQAQPVPEPATVGAVLTGLAMLVARRRRSR